MSPEEKDGVHRMVRETVSRLQKSSTSPAHVGARYAKLINLLWKRPPKQTSESAKRNQNGNRLSIASVTQQSEITADTGQSVPIPINTFSWLDLDSVGDFAVQNSTTNFSPGYGDMSFVQDELGAIPIDGIDSQQWLNDNVPGYVF